MRDYIFGVSHEKGIKKGRRVNTAAWNSILLRDYAHSFLL